MFQRQQQRKKFNNAAALLAGILLAAGMTLAGCSDSGTKPVAAPIAVKPAQQPITKGTTTAAEEQIQSVYAYNPVGKRDPFAPIVTKEERAAKAGERPPLERFNLYDFKLTMVIWGGFGYNAMLEGPDGKGYLVRVGTIIGPNKGVVKKITQGTMVVEEKFKSVSGETDRKETVIELRKKQEGMQ